MIYSTESDKNFPVIEDASGVYILAKDGRKYLDFTGANNTVILGYMESNGYPPGNFPGRSIYEEQLCDLLFEKLGKRKEFKFFKNGTDAVSCAIRLAKHCLRNKEAKIYFIGYAGSNNEYVYTIQNTHSPYIVDQNSIQVVFSEFNEGEAKIRIEDVKEVDILVYESRFRDLADKITAKIKICDHLKSGILGLDEPLDDIDLFGKSIANGAPISILTAKERYLDQINGIYYSTTFGGENFGIIGALSTIIQFDSHKEVYLKKLEYAKSVLPKWMRLEPEMIARFRNEHGILFNGHWQLMVPHTKEQIDELKKACRLEGLNERIM